MNGGPQARVSSSAGGSTLITSAPWSPSIIVQIGPASTRERSMTRRPSSAPTLIREEVARDDQLLDLARPLVDAGDARIAVEVLDLDVLAVAHAAVDLHGLVDDATVRLRADELGHRRLAPSRLALVDEPRAVVRE